MLHAEFRDHTGGLVEITSAPGSSTCRVRYWAAGSTIWQDWGEGEGGFHATVSRFRKNPTFGARVKTREQFRRDQEAWSAACREFARGLVGWQRLK